MPESFYSVGIDVGTTTTQVIFSSLTLEKTGGFGCIPTVRIAKKDVLYKSPIHFTPLLSHDVVDAGMLREIVAEEYSRSAIRTDKIATGAVIITGESARKKNAREVARQLSEFAGDFVVCTAGPDYEAVLAGWGAGAGELSKRLTCSIGNFDIGGGTTNTAVFQNGRAVETFAANLGGRLVTVNGDGTVTYVSEKIGFLAETLRLETVKPGARAEIGELTRLAAEMARMIPEMTGDFPLRGDTKRLFIGKPPAGVAMDRIMFSGGVAEYIYKPWQASAEEAVRRYGDIGPLLGTEIRKALRGMNAKLLEPDEKIRATVVGAGNYSVGLSGSTVAFHDTDLPLKNIPVVKISCAEGITGMLGRRIAGELRIHGGEQIAVAVSDIRRTGYRSVKEIAGEIVEGLSEMTGIALVILEEDCAKALGLVLRNSYGGARRVVCLDRIHVEEGDYIDIGRPMCGVVPVVVKSLIFQ